jgi:hypothetical protein
MTLSMCINCYFVRLKRFHSDSFKNFFISSRNYRMWCSRTDYHKNEIMHVSQTWITLLSCTHVMIIWHVYIYWKNSQFEVKIIVCAREFLIDRIDFVQLRQFLEQTLCDSRYDRFRDIWCQISKCRLR